MNQNDVDSMINKIERIQGVQIIAGYSQEKIKERWNNIDTVINLIKDLLDVDSSQKTRGTIWK